MSNNDANSNNLKMLRGGFFNFFIYSTVRSATIKSHRVGVAYRLAQLILLSYIIGLVNLILVRMLIVTDVCKFVVKMGVIL